MVIIFIRPRRALFLCWAARRKASDFILVAWSLCKRLVLSYRKKGNL